MSLHNIIFSNEFTLLIRSKLQATALLLFLLLGCYSIYYGHAEVAKQKDKISRVADSVLTAQMKYRSAFRADTSTSSGKYIYENAALPSLVRFNYNFFAANQPAPLAGLSLGQRDLYAYYYMLNAQNLYTQTLKGDINNPFKLSEGNFDLAFVFIYLLPLLIIALCFDVLSSEDDLGTYSLLRTTPFTIRQIIASKIWFRCLLVQFVMVLLSLIGFITSGVNILSQLVLVGCWMTVLFAYSGLWFVILYFICSFKMNTAFNAVAGIGIWMSLLIVVPSIVNLIVANTTTVSATQLASLMRSRGMSDRDEAMHAALNKFYRYYPWLKPRDTIKTPYFYFQGYSAFLAVDQLKSKPVVDQLYRSVREQNKAAAYFNVFSPAVNAQELLNHFAATDLDRELSFKSAIEKYHHQIFWFSNKALFENRLLSMADYQKEPVFRQEIPKVNRAKVTVGLLQLFFTGLVLFIFARRNLADKRFV